MPYGIDLRERVVSYIQNGGKHLDASRLFSISTRTIHRWLSREELSPSPRGPYKSKIDTQSLYKDVKERPDTLLKDRSKLFGVTESGMSRALKRLKIVKKND